jgi:transposase
MRQRQILQSWQRSRVKPQGLSRRAGIILRLDQGATITATARSANVSRSVARTWAKRFLQAGVDGLSDLPGRGRDSDFSPEVTMHAVKIACEMPDLRGRSLSQWDCAEIARELIRSGVVDHISSETVRRMLMSQKLKPWRCHMWLSPRKERDEAFCRQVEEIIDLYTRPLQPDERVYCLDEKTSIQARKRIHPTRPAAAGRPVQAEHEYERKGALNLFAAFDTRSGKVYGRCYERKRQEEMIDFLSYLEDVTPSRITTIRIVCDNVSVHKGKKVKQWLETHPRFVFHFTPVHCSWMNQVEQWFSIFQRKRLTIADFASKADLQAKIHAFIEQWNETAKAFKWTDKTKLKLEKLIAGIREKLFANEKMSIAA